MTAAYFTAARREFHQSLFANKTLTVSVAGVASIADKDNETSRKISQSILVQLGMPEPQMKPPPQTAGAAFEMAVARFVKAAFGRCGHLRPGDWDTQCLGSARRVAILSQFEPYSHLAALDQAIRANPELLTVLGNAYSISPDVIVTRRPEPDEAINQYERLVDQAAATRTIIRAANQPLPILHAVISCKLTLRSDRAQNARSEALNLVRNRKGRLPHIAVVTAEPLPSRLASLALGTGDIDCVYHAALDELKVAVETVGNDDTRESLDQMVEGQRLRDIADLPLDMTV
ncbi:MAG: NgoMIV family type II restriction endonuclease [Bifidobacteriaceae bacterium]|nr:NgoMIV family type II restriction endonuclease [Bifidobacteriaceae bacterium]